MIHELDKLTHQAQAALRRTMETYMPYCRIVANCESLSKVIAPVRSRCLQVRIPAPSHKQVIQVLQKISSREMFELPQALAVNISQLSNRNLRRAIMMLQTIKLKNQTLTTKTHVPVPEYETFTQSIVKDVLAEQSPKQLRMIRSKVYEMLVKGITPEQIFAVLVSEFLKSVQQGSRNIPDSIKPEMLRYAVEFEHRCKEGTKAIMHIEAFLARAMCIYRNH